MSSIDLDNDLRQLGGKYSQTGGGGIPFSAMSSLKGNLNSRPRRPSRPSRSRNRSKPRRTRSRPRRSRNRPRRSRNRRRSRTRKKGQQNQQNQSKCKCGIHSYTGNEGSPHGLGICSICTPTLVIRKGNDGSLYENRNNLWMPF